jgi:hypothetical protein
LRLISGSFSVHKLRSDAQSLQTPSETDTMETSSGVESCHMQLLPLLKTLNEQQQKVEGEEANKDVKIDTKEYPSESKDIVDGAKERCINETDV